MSDDTQVTPDAPPAERPVISVDDFESVHEAAAWVDRELEALATMESECETYRKIAEHRKAEADAWVKQQTDRVQRQMEHHRGLLEYAARQFPYLGGKKSIDLIHGSIGTRLSSLSVEIRDEARALTFSYVRRLPITATLSVSDPEHVALLDRFVTENPGISAAEVEPRKDALLAFARKMRESDPSWLPHALDDGWTLNGGQDEPFIRVRKAGD